MNKLLASSLASFVFAACGNKEEPNSKEAPAKPSPEPKEVALTPVTPQSVVATEPIKAPSTLPPHLEAALSAEGRPDGDKERDDDRKPGQVLQFFGVEPGMTVADLMAGTGYFSEVLSRAVGPKGKVYGQNNKWVLERFAQEGWTKRLENPDLSNIVRTDKELGVLGLPDSGTDFIFMGLFYHDTFWLKVDRPKMNKDILAALKPGGIFGLTDHHAKTGSGEDVTETLHRVDAKVVKKELIEAGFEFVGQSDLLQHLEDARDTTVFDKALRGKTDRFIYKFRKPLK